MTDGWKELKGTNDLIRTLTSLGFVRNEYRSSDEPTQYTKHFFNNTLRVEINIIYERGVLITHTVLGQRYIKIEINKFSNADKIFFDTNIVDNILNFVKQIKNIPFDEVIEKVDCINKCNSKVIEYTKLQKACEVEVDEYLTDYIKNKITYL